MMSMDVHLEQALKPLLFHMQTAKLRIQYRLEEQVFQMYLGWSLLGNDTSAFGSTGAWAAGYVLKRHKRAPQRNGSIGW